MCKGLLIVLVAIFWLPAAWFAGQEAFGWWLYRCDASAAHGESYQSHVHHLGEGEWLPGGHVLFRYPHALHTIVYFHGRGRSRHYNYWHLGQMHHRFRANILVFEYPHCHGVACPDLSARDCLLREARVFLASVMGSVLKLQNVTLMCASFGCSVMVRAVQEELMANQSLPVQRIILENPASSMWRTALFHLERTLGRLPEWTWHWLRAFFGPHDWNMGRLHQRMPANWSVLLLQSGVDELVDPASGQAAAQALFGNNYQTFWLVGSNHGDASAHPDYMKRIDKFLNPEE